MDGSSRPAKRNLSFLLVILAAIVVTASQLDLTPASIFARLSQGDNDDILRFLSVRSFLQGQSWFDMTQYRVLAPEGLSLHWSRYVDLMIAALVSALSLVVSSQTAEALALVFWPLTLFAVLVLVTALNAKRVLGPEVAVVAVFSLITWPIFLEGYFAATRVDHHNVQILLLTVLIFSLAGPSASLKSGIIGGAAAAVSLAIGLETALAIGLAGVILALRTAYNPEDEAPQLLGFVCTTALLAVLLFLGQTPANELLTPYCDELSPPFLALLGAGAVLVWVFRSLALRTQKLHLRLTLLLCIGIVGALVAVALLNHCRGGPYGNLPQSVRDIIHTRIVEARPAIEAILTGEQAVYISLVPVMAAVVFAPLAWFASRRTQTPGSSRAVAVFFAFSLLGLLGMLSQVRFVVLAAAAVPTLTGYVLHTFLMMSANRGTRAIGIVAVTLAISLTLLFPWTQPVIASRLSLPDSSTQEQRDVWDKGCRSIEHLLELSQYSAGVVLAPDPIGSSLLLVTDHTIIAAPYHRSEVAMGNIEVPFTLPETEFRELVHSRHVDYVVTCRLLKKGANESFFREMALGTEEIGFQRLALSEDSPLIAYRVIR